MTISERLWQAINPYYLKISVHPFTVELANGTLSKERFEFYIQQDISYLTALSTVYARIAQRSTTDRMSTFFLNISQDALAAGRNLAKLFLGSARLSADIAPSEACAEYSHFLNDTVTSATFEESIVAVLPCLWMYRELSRKMAIIAQKNNPYIQWIELNASQSFSDMTDQVIAFVNEVAQTCIEKTFNLMVNICQRASHFEWRFWEDAYQMRTIQTKNSRGTVMSQDWTGIQSVLDSHVFDGRSTPALLV